MNSINQESIAEQVAEYLRKSIEDGAIKEGSKLIEQDICDELQVSRTPVREAFRILQVEGYLQHRARFGVVVTELSIKDVYDAWEVRSHLEQMVAQKTASNCSDQTKKVIKQQMVEIEQALKADSLLETSFRELDDKYYNIHVSNCGNRKLEEVARQLRLSSALMCRKPKYSEKRARIALQEIKEIYQAYLDGDPEKAVICNKAHFAASLDEIKRYL